MTEHANVLTRIATQSPLLAADEVNIPLGKALLIFLAVVIGFLLAGDYWLKWVGQFYEPSARPWWNWTFVVSNPVPWVLLVAAIWWFTLF